MMQEVLNRRFKNPNSLDAVYPDVIIIDGGRGQYNTVHKILKEKKLHINLLSVSKGIKRNSGKEILHLENKNINLAPNNSLLFFIQRIRDEAHRFAITTHRV